MNKIYKRIGKILYEEMSYAARKWRRQMADPNASAKETAKTYSNIPKKLSRVRQRSNATINVNSLRAITRNNRFRSPEGRNIPLNSKDDLDDLFK